MSRISFVNKSDGFRAPGISGNGTETRFVRRLKSLACLLNPSLFHRSDGFMLVSLALDLFRVLSLA